MRFVLTAPTHVLKRSIEVEAACRDAFRDGENSAEYRHKLRSLYQNLRSQSNPTLRFRVLSGALSASRLVVMTHDELKSDERRAEDEKLLKENMAKAMVAQVEKSITTALRCGKCGQKKVSYSQAQTRSADEPMTTFCECQHCGNRWKVSLRGRSSPFALDRALTRSFQPRSSLELARSYPVISDALTTRSRVRAVRGLGQNSETILGGSDFQPP